MTDLVLPPGTILQSRYRIERLIAQGGMGAVYQALDERLGNMVALKHILVSDTRMRKAFEREARLLAGLRHQVLPVVSDHFTEELNQFLVMQFIPGDDLGTILDRKRDTFTSHETLLHVLGWADQLLDALDYLHSHQPPIIHRDIKPQNLKLTPRGELILLDFGLAKGSVNPAMTSMTGHSLRAYTTQYAPLEQIQGTGTEPRSDLYALGATLYFMLTGEAPANALTRAAAVLAGKPDPMKPAHALNPAIPPTLGAVLQQAMSPGINKRFASAAAMRTALQMVHQSITTKKEHPEDAASFNSAGDQTIVLSTSETSVSAPRLHEVLDMARAASTSAASAPLIVSQLGQGHFPSITAALEAAAPGTRILVRPGLYQEQLIITKPVEIIGDGPQAGIIIESSAEHVLVMQAEQATVRGLTLRGYTDTNVLDTPTRATVNVPRGRLALEQCDIASDNRLCVLIHGALADPSLWRCKIHSSNGVGVLIYGRAHGRLEECDICEHAQAGIVVRSGANPTIRRCKIHHCAQDGIYVDQKGMGVIEECDISQNARAGVEIRRDSTPLLRHCTIHHQTEGYGMFICEHGEGIIEECDISQNARAGVAIVQNSTPLLRRCKIHRERQRGIFFSDQAQGVIERCEIVENARVGIEIRRESNPIVRYCKINRHGAVGIWVHDGGAGMIEHSDLTGNTRGALLIEEGCRVLQRDNTK